MKLNLVRKNLVTTVIVSIVLILLLGTFVTFVFINDLSISVKENRFRFEQADKSNKEYLEQIEFKGDLSRVIKDVNYTTVLVLDYVTEGDLDKKIKKVKVWNKRILPVLDTLDNHIDKSTSDFIKFNFNKLYDEISKNKFLQNQLLSGELKDSIFINKAVKDLKRSSEKLSENYSSFLASKPEQTIITFEPVTPFKKNFIQIGVFVLIISAIIILLINFLIGFLTSPVVKIKKYLMELEKGDAPDDIRLILDDYQPIARNLNSLRDKFSEIKGFAQLVADNEYEGQTSVRFDREGELGVALVNMQNNLKSIAIQDKQRNHINEGLASFSEILSSYTNNMEEFGDVVLKDLVKFLNANQGAFYVVMEEEEVVKMVSCYAYEKKKYLDLTIKKGQGLVGQVWQEGKSIYLTEVPEDYVTITSGLGESTPKSILVVPLFFNDQAQGVIELASFNEFEEYELGFVEKVAESISAALSSVKINTKTQRLLQDSSDLTNQMREQEDLMLSKVEELNRVQEESRQREIVYRKEINRLKKRIEAYERSF